MDKGGILGFTRCLARHVADMGITVNALGLGSVGTACGEVVAFLASDSATNIPGEMLAVNGGVHIA